MVPVALDRKVVMSLKSLSILNFVFIDNKSLNFVFLFFLLYSFVQLSKGAATINF